MKKANALILFLVLLCQIILFPAGTAETACTVDGCGLRGYDENAGWQYVIMGYYPYEKDGTKAPVLWQVLVVEDGKALLYTTYVIDVHQPTEVSDKKIAENKKYPKISDYGETDLNRWLNEVMIENLLEDEPVLAAVTEEKYSRLYPLTDYELMTEEYGFTHQRFYEVRSRWAYATPYALNVKLHPNYGSKLQKDRKYGTVAYWVAALKRDEKGNQLTGRYLQLCAGIQESHMEGDTNIGHLSFGYLNRTTVGLRVALRLDVSKIQVISGNGTIWDPCRLAYVADKEAEEKEVQTPPLRPEPTPVPTTPAPVKGRPTLAPPSAETTPVPVPDWAKDGTD